MEYHLIWSRHLHLQYLKSSLLVKWNIQLISIEIQASFNLIISTVFVDSVIADQRVRTQYFVNIELVFNSVFCMYNVTHVCM